MTRLRTKRIFVHGIPDLKVPHDPMPDPTKWYENPPDSVMVFDECQRVFPKRSASSAVPKHVSEFETLRHNGHMAILITQHPGLIDADLRKLIGRHVHVERILGSEQHFRYELPRVWTPETKADRKAAARSRHGFNKRIFELYKSAEVHTVKRHIPPALKRAMIMVGIVCPLLLIGSIAMFVHKKDALVDGKQKAGQQGSAATGKEPNLDKLGLSDSKKHVLTAAEYSFAHAPRVQGFPMTAPYYDAVQVPKVAPKPAACIQGPKSCKCWTQQATPVYMPEDTCKSIVANGWFDDTVDPENQREREREQDRSRAAQPVIPNGPTAQHGEMVAAADAPTVTEPLPRDIPASAPVAMAANRVRR